MEEQSARYWCHACSQIVDPIREVQTIKCSLCCSEFVEEMVSISRRNDQTDIAGGSDSLSLWAPILLGTMTNPPRPRRFRHQQDGGDDDEDHLHHHHNNNNNLMGLGETELDRELESFMRRRRRSSATILHLLQGIRAGMVEGGSEDGGSRPERERVILINPFNQTIIVQGGGGDSQNHPIGSLGDYFVGPPGLELLLQHLAENDPNRYGTPPSQKEAVEALPTVKIEEWEKEKCLQCCVCLEDFDVGSEAKEMPCKHRFHGDCIFPWLELHSSCPVCRYQLPFDESRLVDSGRRVEETNNVNGEEADDSGRRFPVSLPWPFSSLFSSSGSQTANTNTNSNSSSSSSGTVANSNADAAREGSGND